jgi:hypothetical protein
MVKTARTQNTDYLDLLQDAKGCELKNNCYHGICRQKRTFILYFLSELYQELIVVLKF